MSLIQHIESEREQLFYRLHVLVKESGRAFQEAVSTSCTKLEILLYIEENVEVSQWRLKNELGLDPAAITRHLRDLKDKRLISSRKKEEDKRITLVTLTSSGKNELMELLEKKREFLNKMTFGFSDEEIEILTSSLKRIGQNIQSISQSTS